MALPDKTPGEYRAADLAAEYLRKDGDPELDAVEEALREPTQVTQLLEDFEAVVGRSRETMTKADLIAARAQRLVRRRKDTPVRLLRAVRDSVAPTVPKSDD